MSSRQDSPEILSSSLPFILLASDSPRIAEALYRDLQQEGFRVHFAPGYAEIEPLWQQHQHEVVLLEVSSLHSVESAVDIALRLKRRDANQFVGYLADPLLHTSGLAGDAIFPRATRHLPQALRDYFGRER
jgi:CheY-like chemotaxis protein